MREVDQELFDAVEQGNLNRVQRCVNRGANIRAIKPVKRSPSLLSRVGGVVAYFMGYGNTPLDVAREKGHKEIVIYLLDEETTILCREREGEKALEAYKEMFDIQKDKLGRNHPDTLRTQYNMALALDSLYEWDKALRTYQEVFEKRRDVLGLDHPKTLETHNKIEKMREKIRRNEEQNLQLAREEKRRREKKEEWERERQASEPNVTYEDIQRQAEDTHRERDWKRQQEQHNRDLMHITVERNMWEGKKMMGV